MLKSGDKVTVYADPLTEECAEGEAILGEKLGGSDQTEFWEVMFIDEPFEFYPRWIKSS